MLQKELLKFIKQTMNQPESSQIVKTKADWPAKINKRKGAHKRPYQGLGAKRLPLYTIKPNLTDVKQSVCEM